jgi:6-pyruvoyltetrahydropterin/6-carboxytetrahydropterin synthase
MSRPPDDGSGGSSGVAQFRVRVTKDHLVFSAAHFITFAGGICERLHGHNWRTAVELVGPLDENHYVFDFIALRDALQKIVDGLDHHVLLPAKHPQIRVEERATEVEATFEKRRWLFPREDCVLLPIENTTAELIAFWIAGQLRQKLNQTPHHTLETLRVEVEENFGQSAFCELPLASRSMADSERGR